MTPNKKSCVNLTGSQGGMYFQYNDSFIGAASFHSGGVNALMLDGSVKFIKDSVNINSWLGLSTINGGEVISADSL
jgi:prepilin-type processing-associated H-X9-DG protein